MLRRHPPALAEASSSVLLPQHECSSPECFQTAATHKGWFVSPKAALLLVVWTPHHCAGQSKVRCGILYRKAFRRCLAGDHLRLNTGLLLQGH